MYRKMIFLFVLFLCLTGCGPLLGDVQIGIETPDVQGTDEPLVVTQEPLPTEEPSPAPEITETPMDAPVVPGTVSGNICFPSEMIPAMTVYFQDTASGTLYETAIVENQSTYVIELPAGQYVAFAYPDGSEGFGGMYSQAVLCGLGVGCTDHALLPFEVLGNDAVNGIHLCDWYSSPDVPVNPKAIEQVAPEFSGLVYRNNGAIWQVDSNGAASPILNTWDAIISPDNQYILFENLEDIFVADLLTGETRNITNTPDRVEGILDWIPGTPPSILFASHSVDEEVGLSSGYLSIVSLDGTGYQVLADWSSVFDADASPDGQSIVFSTFDAGWFYRASGEIEQFIPSEYGLDNVDKIGSVSWSPDGTRLAWWVIGDFGTGIAIIDLDNKTSQLLHVYTPIGGSPAAAPEWNSTGEWVVSHVLGEGSKGALWAMRVDGSNELNLGNAGDFVWRPDGQALVFVRWPENDGPAQDATLQIVEIGTWTPREVPISLGSFPLAWLIND